MAMQTSGKQAVLAGRFAIVAAVAFGAPEAQAFEPTHRDPRMARLAQLSDAQLKGIYVGCSRAAVRGALASNEIQTCSLVYELLLQRTFKGDFLALLAWSRSERQAAPMERPD